MAQLTGRHRKKLFQLTKTMWKLMTHSSKLGKKSTQISELP